jgi:hemerythrin
MAIFKKIIPKILLQRLSAVLQIIPNIISRMKKYSYPGYNGQKSEHDSFIEKIKTAQEKVSVGKLLSIEITDFLKNWLIEHIKKSDKNYFEFFVSKGVK